MSNIENGYYPAKPTCCGLITTKNGNDMFAIELEVDFGANGKELIVRRYNLDDDKLDWLVRDAETIGVDTDQDIMGWEPDTFLEVKVKIEVDPKYGPSIKGIYSRERKAGEILKFQGVERNRMASLSASLTGKIHALKTGSKPKPAPATDYGIKSEPAAADDQEIPF